MENIWTLILPFIHFSEPFLPSFYTRAYTWLCLLKSNVSTSFSSSSSYEYLWKRGNIKKEFDEIFMALAVAAVFLESAWKKAKFNRHKWHGDVWWCQWKTYLLIAFGGWYAVENRRERHKSRCEFLRRFDWSWVGWINVRSKIYGCGKNL